MNNSKVIKEFLLFFILIHCLCFGTLNINAQDNFQLVGIKQLSFIEPREQVNSTYFIMNGNIQGLTTPRFLNVFAKLSESEDAYDWVIQNAPLVPFPQTEMMSLWFNLTYLGLESGTQVSMLYIADFVTDTFMIMPPLYFAPSSFVPTTVNQAEYVVGNGFVRQAYSIGFFEKVPLKFSQINVQEMLGNLSNLLHYRGCKVPNIDLDNTTNPPGSFEDYAGDKNACGPAATANSVEWLENIHPEINTSLTLRQKLVELSNKMKRGNNSGVTTQQFIRGKLDFIEKYKLPIKVKFQASDTDTNNIKSSNIKGYEAQNLNANKLDKTKWAVTWDFLFKEIKNGEVVELLLDSYTVNDEGQIVHTGGHIVAVSGVSQIGGIKRVWVKDDINQNNSGSTQQTLLTWQLVNEKSGIPYLKEWSEGPDVTIVSGIVSQSFDSTVTFEPPSPPKPKIGNFKLYKINFKNEDTKMEFSKNLLLLSYTPISKPMFMNIVQLGDNSKICSWLAKNVIIPQGKRLDSIGLWVKFLCHKKSTEKKSNEISETDDIKVSIIFSDSILKSLPNIDTIYTSKINQVTAYSINDLTDNAIAFGFGMIEEPVFYVPTNPQTIYNTNTMTTIDLNASIYNSTTDPNYAGDFNAGNPASASIAFDWLKRNYSQINDNTNIRTKLELLSKFMNRQKDKGSTALDLIKGKLAFVDSLKLPISIRFQLVNYDKDSILSPNRIYGNFAKNMNIEAGYPTWDFISSEIKNGRTLELMLQWTDKDGRLLGSKTVTVAGVSNANGQNVLWLNEDFDHRQPGGTVITQSLFKVTSTAISRSYLYDRSSVDTICWVVGAVSQGYDPNIRFLSFEDEIGHSPKFALSISQNPVYSKDLVSVICFAPDEGIVSIKLSDINGSMMGELINEPVIQGKNEFKFFEKLKIQLPSGVYYIVANYKGQTEILPIIIVN